MSDVRKKTIKIVVLVSMAVVFLLLFATFAIMSGVSATAQNTKEIRILQERIERLEKNY